MKVLVDNFAVLGIENCLLNMLPETFSPDTVMGLGEGLTEDIARETEDSLNERSRVTRKLDSLEAGLKTLNRLGQYKRFRKLPGETDAISTSRLQKASSLPEKKDSVNLNTTAASTSEEVVEEDGWPLPEENGDLDIEQSDWQEASAPLSPFDRNGSLRSDDSWLNGGSKFTKQKKERR